MASSRRTGTNENISTYGDVTRDYQEGEFSLWEQATDINLVTAEKSEVLECYDDQDSFSENAALSGATTNSSYFRIVRPANGQGHDGTPNNGFTFSSTVNNNLLQILENYSQIQDIIGQLVIDSVTDRDVLIVNCDSGAFIGCIVFDSVNEGTGNINSNFRCIGTKSFCINCLSYNNPTGYGFFAYATNGFFYNCTSVNNQYGFGQIGGTTQVAKNCCASGNTNDWSGTWTKTTCTDEDAAPSYMNPSNKDFHLASNDTVCRDQGTDLSEDADYPFDDDIDGETILGTWDIGFDERIEKYTLVPADLYHEHYCDSLTLVVILSPVPTIHEHVVDNVVLYQVMVLVIQNAYHAHVVEAVVLGDFVPGPHYLGIALELPVIGLTQYQGYNFNSMVKFGDVYLGANSHGIYTLDTKDDDDGVPILSILKTMTTDLGLLHQKRIRKAYLGYESSGDIRLRVQNNDGNTRTYTLSSTLESQEQHGGEISIDRDGKGRYWSFQLENSCGCDFSIDELSIIPLVLTRKP